MNDKKQVKSLARQMHSYFWRVPYANIVDARYKQAANTPDWVQDICNLCYIEPFESTITNRFVMQVLDHIITSKIVDNVERNIRADIYLRSQLQWLAESDFHIDYLNYAQNIKKDLTIEQALSRGQLIRKQEIARIVLKSLRETKKEDATPGKKLRPKPVRLTLKESTTE